MPIFDFALPELHKYQGRNPCPPDMDAFWDKALAELRATKPKVELVPHALTDSLRLCY